MSRKVEYLQELLKSCFVPELKRDLDSLPIQSEYFTEYHQMLEQQLPQLYDFIQQNEVWIWESQDQENLELNASLLLLFCEITAPAAPYALENEYLLQNADKVLQRQMRKLSDKQDAQIFTYYKDKLRIDCWKRYLGAVHGIMRFLGLRFTSNNTRGTPLSMSNDWLTFCLSVALNFGDCHEPIYKHFSTQIFHVMLCSAKRSDILELNIHSVIYASVFQKIHTTNTVPENAAIWNCMLLCMDFYDDIESLSWTMADDMMEALLRNISLTTETLVCICLLKFVTQLGFYFSTNRKEIEKIINSNLNSSETLNNCRHVCAKNSSYTPFRWAKNIIQTFTSEAYKLMAGANTCRQLLLEIHRCYMVCILPIPLELSQHILIPFWSKFIATLMETLVVQKQELDIISLVKSILETFHHQLKYSAYCEKKPELLNYRNSIEKLLKENIFCK